ncbi:MAG: hemerythrin domain-containing protein [Chloroflexi bacterium]|nr:hemerythrin domain-containing protein [Chloroflexota bacterium]
MDYLAALKDGHHAGQEKLTLLSRIAESIDGQQEPAGLRGQFQEVFNFFDGEMERHFRQEEKGLFPALVSAVGRAGVVSAMLEEHHSIWRAVDAMDEQLSEIETASSADRKRIAQSVKMVARHIAGLLRSHIEKEDTMLFPLAERVLSQETLKDVATEIERQAGG